MASINDFKLLNSYCLKYFAIASQTQEFDKECVSQLKEIEKKRYGFYYYVINQILDIDDFNTITNSICDQDFNSRIKGQSFSDEGIDAIYIDRENQKISLFNFKFRESFNQDKLQSKNEAILSGKFLSILKTGKIDLTGPLKNLAKEIIDLYNGATEWDTTLYIVSNENRELTIEDKNLADFAELFAVKIECIGLDTITALMLPSHPQISAKINLPTEAVMSFSETSLSSNISYVIRLRLTDLIRITCNNSEWRNDYQMEEEGKLAEAKEEIGVLFDNIRGLIANSKYNRNIENTLLKEPSKFFYYNNGLTLVAQNVDFQEINSGKRIKLELQNFQVLNGGQTLRTIHNFNRENPQYISDVLSKAEVLVRVLRVTDLDLKNKIGEYTNSQNAIKISDLKSLRKEQLELESFLSTYDILYIRKRGFVAPLDANNFKYAISMERLGQILWASKGYPEMVSNKKKEIFSSQYDFIFGGDELITQKTVELIKKYHGIKQLYEKSQYDFSDQKGMYIIFLCQLDNRSIELLIGKFEEYLDKYIKEKQINISPARILITPKFKDDIKKTFVSGI